MSGAAGRVGRAGGQGSAEGVLIERSRPEAPGQAWGAAQPGRSWSMAQRSRQQPQPSPAFMAHREPRCGSAQNRADAHR